MKTFITDVFLGIGILVLSILAFIGILLFYAVMIALPVGVLVAGAWAVRYIVNENIKVDRNLKETLTDMSKLLDLAKDAYIAGYKETTNEK